MNFNAQLRFAKLLTKKKDVTAKQLPMKRVIDVPLSSEMVDWLNTTMESSGNELGLPELKEDVRSVLIQPLDSMSVYCPVGAMMHSQLAAARLNAQNSKTHHFAASDTISISSPNQLNGNSMLTEGASFGFNRKSKEDEMSLAESVSVVEGGSLDVEMGHSSTLSTWAQNKKPPPPVAALPINSAVSRLKVMWLQRKAQFQRNEGNLDDAMETLSDALELHLGTRTDYKNANLSDQTHTDPSELLDYIGDTYVMYDKMAHIEAGRIQRCFLRHLRFRHKMATKVQAFFRMFLVRNSAYQRAELQKQCCQLIQRIWRKRLAWKRYNSTKIKRWYKCLKQQEDFKKRLFIYRMARRIQRLWRGNKNREISWQRKCEKLGNQLLQRQIRSYNSRRQRTLAIKFFHRMYFRAARTIQRMVRLVQAVQRSQLKLLLELAREEERQGREKEVIEETVKVQIAKTRLYMKTDAGREHMKIAMNRIRLQDKEYNKLKGGMDKKEIMAREAMVSFELFDSDGSGQIDADELAGMLQELCIPLSAEEFAALMKEIDADGSGEIDFGEFLEWYTGGGGEDAADNATMAQKTFKLLLQARHAIMEISGQILLKRAERSILRQATAWLTKDITASFRNTRPPKFQCCQCLQPFVMFTDYYAHFDEAGICGATNQKAMFFNKFWVQSEWRRQRQCEHEVMRLNDEIPNINYHAYMASVADMSLFHDAGVDYIMKLRSKAAQIMFMEKATGGDGKIEMRKEILGAINICKDNFISALTAMMVSERLGKVVPKDWVLEDRWDLKEFDDWLVKVVDHDIALRKSLLTFSSTGKLKRDAWVVADIYVRVIRMLQVIAEASLMAIIDSRSRRPRRIAMTDDELKAGGLEVLSEAKFNESREVVVERLRMLNEEIQKIFLIRIPKRCVPKKNLGVGEVQVGPDGLIDPDALQEILVNEAHVRAIAKYNSRQRSRVGKVQLRRLSCELWANRRLLWDQYGKAKKFEAEMRFFYNRFASAETGDGIDFHDFAIVERALSLRIKAAVLESVKKLLDPRGTGYITFEHLLDFITGGRNQEHYHTARALYNGIVHVGKVAVQRLYTHYAQQTLVSKMRKVSRLELEFRNTSVKALLLSAKLPSHRIREHNANRAFRNLSATKALKALEKAGHRRSSIAALSKNNQSVLELLSAKDKASAGPEVSEHPWVLTIPDKPTRYSLPPLPVAVAEPPPPSNEDLAAEIQIGIQLKELSALDDSAELLNNKLQRIRTADEEGENLLLYRLAEDKAEGKCKRRLVSRQGLYNLRTEKLIMSATDRIMEAYGFLIPPSSSYPWTHRTRQHFAKNFSITSPPSQQTARKLNFDQSRTALDKDGDDDDEDDDDGDDDDVMQLPSGAPHEKGWDLTLAVLVYAFDTDCSGTFDEGEVRLLLKCAFCGLSEQKVLYHFPEVRLGSATLQDVVKYLAPKVGWRRGKLHRLGHKGSVYVSKKTGWQASAMLLISLSRQMAREKAMQATSLARTGALMDDDDDRNDDAIIMRSQMFAMRQVHMFFKTSQGKIQLLLIKKKVKHWWREDCWRSGFQRQGLLQYAYLLHAERINDKGIMVTELPHLIHYLVVTLGFKTNGNVAQLADILHGVKAKDDVTWYTRAEALALVDTMLAPSAVSSVARHALGVRILASRSAHSDAIVNMNSRARQQAILVALNFDNIFVAETNYRCSILGLSAVLKENARSKQKRSDILMNWQRVPKEATTFLLLSRGYNIDDLGIGEIPKWAEVQHRHGGIAMEKVDVSECLKVARETTSTMHTNLQAAYRWSRWMAGLPRYLEYKKIAKAVSLQKREINEAGAAFLREILKGQSHCVGEGGDDDEDDD